MNSPSHLSSLESQPQPSRSVGCVIVFAIKTVFNSFWAQAMQEFMRACSSGTEIFKTQVKKLRLIYKLGKLCNNLFFAPGSKVPSRFIPQGSF